VAPAAGLSSRAATDEQKRAAHGRRDRDQHERERRAAAQMGGSQPARYLGD
jgi:hypothetical protein